MKVFLDILAVALGGALGASTRYGVGRTALAMLKEHPLALPAATLAVNIAGCLAIGLVLPWLLAREGDGAPHHLRLLVVVGALGAFTTYSTFGVETFMLWREGRAGVALASVALHLVLGFAAVACGVLIGERVIA
ncbi:MAG: fluoride efflux transporter CrcB [Phycisphaerales bacterium]